MLILNFAHPLSEDVAKGNRIVTIAVDLSQEALGDPDQMKKECIALVADVLTDKAILGAVMAGRYLLVPPGLTAAAGAVIAALHGVSGHFPRIIWAFRGAEGFATIKGNLDLQGIRETFRSRRDVSAGVAFYRELARQNRPQKVVFR